MRWFLTIIRDGKELQLSFSDNKTARDDAFNAITQAAQYGQFVFAIKYKAEDEGMWLLRETE